ncbi:iron ABC transporter substrate-binding protein [Treponema primitia ZAS-2]|uniref:Iron ABC transporter substrate-binding protein n=1 Tax=Treponema primitia (strain ATCC BAA-887 / DSM 12427 / ZAS-2) TaxID=545694 RepID=F5YKF2_TREPZ|nr:ABC transporter substrate-binding protein [Treponema primitia]AEF83789.1 iron ABC transporter substrate-binding protein [Treponema primitia ZAS-2]
MKHRLPLFLFVSILLAACTPKSGQSAGTAAPAYNQLTVYSALPDQEIPTYFNAFEKDTGIHVNYVRLSAGEMMARISAEKNNPQASLMHGGSSDTYVAANKEGLLSPYQSSELANIPAQYHDADGVWNPIYVGAIAFVCNTDWFKENNLKMPTSWADLVKPEFKGQVSMAHPATSGTSYTVLATLIQLFGETESWNYLKKLDANVRQYTKAGAAPPQEAALGEAAIAITFSHDGLKPKMEGYPVELVFPTEGTGYEVGGVALIKNGFEKEQENAKRFIDWFMSVRGQELFIDAASNRLPVNTKAKYTPGLVSLDDLPIINYDAVWAGQNKAAFVAKFNDLIENTSNLKE